MEGLDACLGISFILMAFQGMREMKYIFVAPQLAWMMLCFMPVRFRHFVKIRDDTFLAQKGLLQQARLPSVISASLVLFYSLGVVPSRDRAFRHSSNTDQGEQ